MLPQDLVSNWGTLKMDFETTVGWTAQAGTMGLDNIHVKTGANSLESTSAVGGEGKIQYNWGGGAAWIGFEEFRFWCYTPDITKFSSPTVTISFWDTTGTKSASLALSVISGWNYINAKRADFALAGGFAWTDQIQYLRFRINGAVGQQAVMSYDSFYISIIPQAAIVVTFDDCNSSVYDYGLSLADAHNIPCTFFVRTGIVGNIGQVTVDNLLEMRSLGWVIANHTQNHIDLTTLAQVDAQAEIEAGQNDLLSFGITGNDIFHLAYPGGAYNSTVEAAATAANCLTARGIYDTPNFLCRYRILPFANPLEVWSKILDHAVTLAAAKTWVDNVSNRSEIGILLLHNLIAGIPALDTEWNINDFDDLLAYIASLNIPCITVDQLYDLQSGPVKVRMPI